MIKRLLNHLIGGDMNESRIKKLQEQLEDVSGLSALFKVLGDETRTKIIHLLSLETLCVTHIARVMGMTEPAVSHHLRLLKAHRLVKFRREGKMVFYTLDDDHIVNLITQAREHYREHYEEDRR